MAVAKHSFANRNALLKHRQPRFDVSNFDNGRPKISEGYQKIAMHNRIFGGFAITPPDLQDLLMQLRRGIDEVHSLLQKVLEGPCHVQHGLRCADLVESEWVETCDSNVCQLFYPDLPCRSDGDGPRISCPEEDGAPSPSSECVYHDWPWDGWSCDWVEREDDVRICPCE